MNLRGKKIAILGGTRISCEIVLAAQNLGMNTTVIDYNPPELSPAKQIADNHALISVADVDSVVSYIKENCIDGVITGYTDSILVYYADICRAAGLPCYGTREQFEIFADKQKWKALCTQFNVPTGRSYDAETLGASANSVNFPVFVKPADGSGSRGVSIARNVEELHRALNLAKSFAKNGNVLVEDYLEGDEATVFWLFTDGDYHVSMLGNRIVKHNQKGAIPLPAGYTFPAAILPNYLERIAPNVRDMLSSTGIENGMMFMQCIVRDGVPYVYDIGYRLTGSLEHRILKVTAGYSPMDMLLHFAITGKMTDDDLIMNKIDQGLRAPCYNVSFLMSPGTLGYFDGLNKLKEKPSVVAYVKAHVEGEILPPEARGQLRQIALRVLGVVDKASNLEEAMLDVQSTVRIISDDGHDLTLPGLEKVDFIGNVLTGETLS